MTEEYIKLLYIETTGFELDASEADLMGFAREIEKAARRAAFEEAATVVSDHDRKGREWVADSLWGNLANECASRIRALAAGDKNG